MCSNITSALQCSDWLVEKMHLSFKRGHCSSSAPKPQSFLRNTDVQYTERSGAVWSFTSSTGWQVSKVPPPPMLSSLLPPKMFFVCLTCSSKRHINPTASRYNGLSLRPDVAISKRLIQDWHNRRVVIITAKRTMS